MSSISQTIPSYVAGISEQPDQLKLSGQLKDCVNALPDVTRMLGKRPGCEFLREDTENDAHKGAWFDIYRDPTEQYIGSVRENGTVDVFRVVDSPLKTYKDTNGVNDVEERFYTVVTDSSSGFEANKTFTNYSTTNVTALQETPQRSATGLTVDFKTNADGKCEFVTINRVGNSNYKAGDVLKIDKEFSTIDSFILHPNLNSNNIPIALDSFIPSLNAVGAVRSLVRFANQNNTGFSIPSQGGNTDFYGADADEWDTKYIQGSGGSGLKVEFEVTSGTAPTLLGYRITDSGSGYSRDQQLRTWKYDNVGADPDFRFDIGSVYDLNPGVYENLSTTTSGNGTGLTVDVTVSNTGAVTSVSINNTGSGYADNDYITIKGINQDIYCRINGVYQATTTNQNYTNVSTTTVTGNGTGLTFDVEVENGVVKSVTSNDNGQNYEDGDNLVIAGTSIGLNYDLEIRAIIFEGIQATFFDGLAGEQCNVKYDNASHQINDLNIAGTIVPTTSDTNCEYLEHTNSNFIKSLTINDTTAFVNRNVITKMKKDSSDKVVVEPVPTGEGFVEIKVLSYTNAYAFNLLQGTTNHVFNVGASGSQTVDLIHKSFINNLNSKGFASSGVGNGLIIKTIPTNRVADVSIHTGPTSQIISGGSSTSYRWPKNSIIRVELYKEDSTWEGVGTGQEIAYPVLGEPSGIYAEVRTNDNGLIPDDTYINIVGYDPENSTTDFTVFNSVGTATNTLLIRPIDIDPDLPPLEDEAITDVDDKNNFIRLKITKLGAGDSPFNLQSEEFELLNAFTSEVQDISVLPEQCVQGYRVKIANSGALEDDYYVIFEASNGLDGVGTWVEWRKPGIEIQIDPDTMPHIMFRQSDGSFLVCPTEYEERKVGDDITNPLPSFIGNKINNVTLYRNRLAFLSNQNLILSRPGDFFNFFVATALAITAKDPIDISAASPKPATLFDAIEVNTGLILFSRSQQFMLTTDNDILSAETAKINFVSSFNYNENVSPFSLGTTIGFLNDEGSNTRLYEMSNPPREGQPEVIEQSKIISNLYPTGINRIATSKNNAIVLTAVSGTPDIFGYRYYNTTDRRLQSAWFKFKMTGDVIYHTIIRDTYWAVVRNLDTASNPDVNIVTIQKMELKQNDGTVTVNNATQGIICYLDNKREIPHTALTYNAGTDETTFTLPWTYDQTKFNATTFETGLTVFQLGDGEDGRVVDLVSAGGTPARINTIDATFQTVTLRGRWDEQTDIAITNAATGTNLATGKFAGLGTTGGSGTGLLLAGEVDIYGDLINVQIVNPGSGYTTGDVVTIEASVGVATTATCTLTITPQSLFVGYAYEMDVQFPVVYPVKGSGDAIRSDVQGSLIIHRFKINTSSTGTFQMELDRKYRDTYSTTHEAKKFDSYLADDIAIGSVDETVVACYDRNTNVDLHLKSSYPLPVTLISMTWEGEYTNKNYRRE